MKAIVIGTMVVWSFLVAYIASNKKTGGEEQFIIEQLNSQLMHVSLGNLAALKGSDEPIRLYGEWMQKDHLEMKQELQAMAIQKNIRIPTSLTDDMAEKVKRLRRLEGNAFDKEYIRMVRMDHLRDIRSLKTASRSTDPDVQAFSLKYLPVLEGHLSALEELPNAEVKNDGSK